MTHPIGVEDMEPGHWLAWDFACPGLTGKGDTPEAAASALAAILGEAVEVAEMFNAHPSAEDPDYLVNAFFEDDQRPLQAAEIERGLAMLAESRQSLLELAAVGESFLHIDIPIERFKTIDGVLRHVAVAEWWYCDRLGGVADWESLPQESLAALDVSRDNIRQFLPRLVGDGRTVTLTGERWSARKMLRRAVWHERDHIVHIEELLNLLAG